MQPLELLAAIAARLGRISAAAGYSSTPEVGIERLQIDPETQRLPFVTVVYDGGNYEREGAAAAGFDITHEVTVVGLTRADFDDRSSAPLLLLQDLERALFAPTNDALDAAIFEPTRVEIIRPEAGESVTETILSLRVRTCASGVNHALEQTP